jgi:hypothetical protein
VRPRTHIYVPAATIDRLSAEFPGGDLRAIIDNVIRDALETRRAHEVATLKIERQPTMDETILQILGTRALTTGEIKGALGARSGQYIYTRLRDLEGRGAIMRLGYEKRGQYGSPEVVWAVDPRPKLPPTSTP